MFYSQFILAKKGPLGTIWIAAHLERKLRKNQVADTDIGVSVDSILFPEMPIALRLSSHLLLGVVRIYSKKVNYLFDDCSEALLKVKQAFRATAVDLPPEESTAPYHSITLPETFDLDDFELPDNDLQGNYVDQHISSKDQITLQDTMEGVVYTTSKFGLDERFGDGDMSGLDLEEDLLAEKAATPELATGTSNLDDDPQASADASAIGILNQDLDDYDGDNEPVDYAEAPSTPGLWEEPNLSNIQETSACDDHQEPENHLITESAVKENLENVFSHDQHHNIFESHEKSPPHIAETEQMLSHDLGSTPFTEPHSAASAIPLFNDPGKGEESLNKNVRDESTGFQAANANHENFVAYQGNQNPGVFTANQNPGVQTANDSHGNFVEYQGNQENTFHLTTELVSNTGKDNRVGTPQYHTPLEPQGSTTPVLFPHDSMPNSNLPSLRPCITFPSHETSAEVPHATEALNRNFPAEVPHATEALNRNFPENFHAEIDQNHQVRVDNVIQREAQVESINSYTSDFSAPVIQREVQVENINNYANDLPAPEKRLSLPHWLSDVPKNFIPESTPIEKDMTSGKKRSFTESSITDRSLNLNESIGFFNTNTTPQSFNLNTSSGVYTTNTTAQSLNLNQSSGFFTTNTTAQSVNLNQSSGFFNTNTTAQSVNLNQSSGFFTTNTTANTTAQSLNLNQSSGFFTTDTSAQSLNLNQSSAPFTIDMSGQSVVNNDDLLSSILVGRKSSILKMKPSPPVATPPTKRRRSTAPKTGVPKRKALMDDNMVLHGDTIRQQLTNTEDIRRLRKKAPCTRFEISLLEKQFWEDDIFSEPIFTGVSVKLASLHNQLYNLSKIVVSHIDASFEGERDPKSISQNDEKDIQPEVRPNVPKENATIEPVAQPIEFPTAQLEVGPNVPRENVNFEPVAQPMEFPTMTGNLRSDNNTASLDYYGSQQPQMAATEHLVQPQMAATEHVVQPQMAATEHVVEPFNSEHDLFGERIAMEIDPKSFPEADIGVSVMPAEVEPPTHDSVVPSNDFDMPAAMSEIQVDASLQTDVPGVSSTEKTDLQSVDMDINSFKSLESNIASEANIDIAPVREASEEKHDHNIEYKQNEEEVVNEDVALASNVDSNVQNSVYNGIFGEEFGTAEAYDTEVNPVLGNVPLDETENLGHDVNLETTEMNMEDIPASKEAYDDEITHPAVVNNTDFLNFDDDDDEADAGGDYAPDVEATRIIDNTGWSSRTKAVAKYLQIMFDKESERGINTLAVNNMLVGKTRKEASRMFFETLVLKTKDYIHVEQAEPFENINIFPRAKLLKSDF